MAAGDTKARSKLYARLALLDASILQGRNKRTIRVTTTYTILVTDEIIFANTDAAAWTATLPVGTEGASHKVINSGTSLNNLTVSPDGTEKLLGVNSNWALADGETLNITYNMTDGWY